MDRGPALVFGTEAYADLATALAAFEGLEAGEVEGRRFPDGERYRRVISSVEDRDVVVVGGTVDDEATLALYDLACGLVANGAHILTLVVPYFGYSTMERATRPGEIVVAKNRARLVSAVPKAGSGNRVVLVDLHVEGLTHYFEDGIRPVHLWARPVVTRLIRRFGGDDFVLGATDAGRAKWVESLANELGVGAGVVLKRRVSGDEVALTAVAAEVEGKRVVIYDDMIRTGGSLAQAARAYLDAGATGVAAVATHGVFPGDAVERLRSSGVLEAIAVTDTHPRAHAVAATHPGFVHVESVAPLVAAHLTGMPGAETTP